MKSGKYSARLTTAELQAHVMIDQEIPARQFAGKTITFGSWIRTNVKEGVGLHVLDFVDGMHDLSGGGARASRRRFVALRDRHEDDPHGHRWYRPAAPVGSHRN
ncbi:MAG TPA: hypothetical protein DIT01_05810 [Lentisphaeria bacterium]|nr:hypothetical protein [Lentisphaeria bacterium]